MARDDSSTGARPEPVPLPTESAAWLHSAAARSPARPGGPASSPSDVGGYAAAARAVNTWRAYRSDFARFQAWCADREPAVSALPAQPGTVAGYLVAHAGTHRPATLARWCSAITVAHDLAGHPAPTRDGQVRTVLAGIRRTHRSRPARVAPATPDRLRAMLAPLDRSRPRDVRDRALLLIGFAAALRRAELAALTLADLVVDAEGLRVFIAASKTDPTATGHTRGLAYGGHPDTCPVRAWQAWRTLRITDLRSTDRRSTDRRPADAAIDPGGAARPEDETLAAFVAIDRWGRLGRHGLADRSIARIIAARADAADLPGHWAGHSLRRGFATTAYATGTAEVSLMRHGRWRSTSAMRSYIDEGTIWSDNPTRRLGL